MGQNGGFMKIRLNASIVKHFKKNMFFIGLVSCMNNFATTTMIVTQFRTPLSLSELLHEGLLSVQEDIEQISLSKEDETKNILTISLEKIEHLQNLYDLMNSKSGLNGIHADERDFLQGLIDRIDQMIQTLEGSSSTSQSDVIKKNISMLHTLRITLEH